MLLCAPRGGMGGGGGGGREGLKFGDTGIRLYRHKPSGSHASFLILAAKTKKHLGRNHHEL